VVCPQNENSSATVRSEVLCHHRRAFEPG
jgi:hypothetical protein